MELVTQITIDSRYCGPPGSGNGGYVCGRIAQYLGNSAQVRLHAPVPLNKSMKLLRQENGNLHLMDEDQLIATGQTDNVEISLIPKISFEQAENSAKHCRGLHFHPFPECFVCGPDREQGDGLRIFPGPVDQEVSEKPLVAAPWIPHVSLADDNAKVLPEFIWAALDCTGSFAIDFSADKVLVLGQFSVNLSQSINADEKCVVWGRLNRVEGRKHYCSTAILNGNQKLCGKGEAIWIAIR